MDEQKDRILSLILNELTTSLFLFNFLRTVLQESLTVNKVGEGNFLMRDYFRDPGVNGKKVDLLKLIL
jgi:hypothetical protein